MLILKLNSWKSDIKIRCFYFRWSSLHTIQSYPNHTIHINTHQYSSLLTQNSKHSTCSAIFWVSLVASAALPPVPSRGGQWCSEATTTSSRQPGAAASEPCGTSCGRCPAPWPRRAASAPPRCTGRRTTATWRSAGCCWRRGPRWTPEPTEASRT